jgi:2-polyprenyl-3-methyl-5-hydroxy-6-metoxy-1,4-benzoquinol methylase
MELKREAYNCALCGEKKHDALYTIKGFNLVQCSQCEFVFVNPRISNEDLPKIYKSNYFNNQDFGYTGYKENEALRKRNFKRWLNDITPYIKEKGNALDIGCASGDFLEILREKSWNIEGIELDPAMFDELKSKKIEFFPDVFDKFNSTKKYDLITLFDVMEHLPDIHGSLTRLKSLLSEDGSIALLTPDYGSSQRKLFGKKWFQFKPVEHIHYFSEKTLAKALSKHDLEIKKMIKPGQYADADFLNSRLDRYGFKTTATLSRKVLSMFGMNDQAWYMDTGSLLAVITHKK